MSGCLCPDFARTHRLLHPALLLLQPLPIPHLPLLQPPMHPHHHQQPQQQLPPQFMSLQILSPLQQHSHQLCPQSCPQFPLPPPMLVLRPRQDQLKPMVVAMVMVMVLVMVLTMAMAMETEMATSLPLQPLPTAPKAVRRPICSNKPAPQSPRAPSPVPVPVSWAVCAPSWPVCSFGASASKRG